MGKVFNKRLKNDEKQEGLLKRLKNIEDTVKKANKMQLEVTKNNAENETKTHLKN